MRKSDEEFREIFKLLSALGSDDPTERDRTDAALSNYEVKDFGLEDRGLSRGGLLAWDLKNGRPHQRLLAIW